MSHLYGCCVVRRLLGVISTGRAPPEYQLRERGSRDRLRQHLGYTYQSTDCPDWGGEFLPGEQKAGNGL